jgi:muramidase (phage lysozyme)
MISNRTAFLDMIAHSEIGTELLAVSDNGYNVLVGSTPAHPLLFPDYAEHPHIFNSKFNSTAAGRYQFLFRDWFHYKTLLHLADFGPVSQDLWAIQLIRERGALPLIDMGSFDLAVARVSNLWASLPGAGYSQHENQLSALEAAYTAAGGVVA